MTKLCPKRPGIDVETYPEGCGWALDRWRTRCLLPRPIVSGKLVGPSARRAATLVHHLRLAGLAGTSLLSHHTLGDEKQSCFPLAGVLDSPIASSVLFRVEL